MASSCDAQRYENIFPQAQIRFKQMDYQSVLAPVEFYVKGDNYSDFINPFDGTNPNAKIQIISGFSIFICKKKGTTFVIPL